MRQHSLMNQTSKRKSERTIEKMSLARFNKASNKFTFKGDNLEFVKLSDLDEGTSYPLMGLFINKKSKYGYHPVAISKTFKVDLPQHLTEITNQIIADDEAVSEINEGKASFKVVSYLDKNNVKRYSIDFE